MRIRGAVHGLGIYAALVAVGVLGVTFPQVSGAQVPGAIQLELPGSLDLLPPGPITADGSPQVLAFVVTDETGGFPAEPTFRFNPAEGRVDARGTRIGPGIWSFEYTPPLASRPRSVALKVTVKAGKKTVERAFTLDLVPPPTGTFEVTANPPQVVLDPGATTLLRFTVKGRDGQVLDGIEPLVTANSGSVGPIRSVGGGGFEAVYTPAAVNFPHVAVLSFTDTRNPESTLGFFALPLVGKVAYPVNTGRPGSTVNIEVGGQVFGPAVAGPDGMARVPISVPPGTRSGKLSLVDAAGARNDSVIDLQVPPFGRIKIGQPAAWMPADGATAIPIRVLVVGVAGRPSAGEKVQIACDRGEVANVRDEGNGLYSATLTLAPVKTPVKATITATLVGEEQTSKDVVTFEAVPALPQGLSLETVPPQPAPSSSAKVSARITVPGGAAVPGLGVEMRTPAGPLKVKDAGGGLYTAQVAVPAGGTVLSSVASFPAAQRPPFALVGWALDDQVVVGGKQTVTIVAVDRYGLPVSGLPLEASLLQGGGSVATPTPTDAHGRSSFDLSAGLLPGLAVVEVRSGALATRVPVWQARARIPDLVFPLAGGVEQVRLQRAWGGLRDRRLLGVVAPAPVAVTPAAPAPAPQPAAPAPQPSAPVQPAPAGGTGPWGEAGSSGGTAAATIPDGARIDLVVNPASLPMDGRSTARIDARLVDAKGRPVAGIPLSIGLNGAGSLVVSQGPEGGYAATFTAPSESPRPAVTIFASTADGAVRAQKYLALAAPPPPSPAPEPVAAAGPREAMLPAPMADTAAEPVLRSTPTAAVRRPIAAEGGRRARVTASWMVADYAYRSTPCDHDVAAPDCAEPDESDLDPVTGTYDVLPNEIAASTPLSFGIDAEWFPVEYVAIAGGVASYGYRTDTEVTTSGGDAATFGDQMWHVFVEARGRIPLLRERGQLDLLPRIGYHGQDVLLFRWVTAEASGGDPAPVRQRQFETSWLDGLRFGLGLRYRAPFGLLEPHGSYDATVSFQVGAVSDHQLELGATFRPRGPLLVDVSYRFLSRAFGFQFPGSDADGDGDGDEQRGEVRERSHAFVLSAGVAL
ncbi:Ig-like domain-containing protein [Myxococcota bacterium]|nr:Ig-like domain-containing protein [Myxococcota bacterium]